MSSLTDLGPLATVPGLMPDELLSSFWRRLLALNPALSNRAVATRIFGNAWRAPATLLPGFLDDFARGIGRLLGLSDGGGLLYAHTMYPLFAAALPLERQLGLAERLRRRHRGGVLPFKPLLATEALGRTVLICRTCERLDQDLTGVSFWRRVHNSPGVAYCITHMCPLDRIGVGDLAALNVRSATQRPTSRRMSNALALARASASLITLDGEGLHRFREGLFARAREQSHRGAGRMIRYTTIAELVCEHFTGGFEWLEIDALVAHPIAASTWIRSLLSSRGRVHPLLVSLLHSALPACSQVVTLRPVPRTLRARPYAKLSADTEAEAIAALHQCGSLTEASRQTGLSVTTLAQIARRCGQAFDVRPSTLLNDVRARVCCELAKGTSVSAVSARERLSLASVYRILAASEATREQRASVLRIERRDRYRVQWDRLLQDHPDWTVTDARRNQQALWTWLHRHDREWLRSRSGSQPTGTAAHQRRRSAPAKITWTHVSSEIARSLEQARLRLLMRPGAARVTRPRLMRAVGLADGRARLIPSARLEAQAAALAESMIQFVERRLSWGLSLALERGVAAEPWRVVKLARLRPSTVAAAGIDADAWLRQAASRT